MKVHRLTWPQMGYFIRREVGVRLGRSDRCVRKRTAFPARRFGAISHRKPVEMVGANRGVVVAFERCQQLTSGLDAGVILDRSCLLATQTVAFQGLVEEFCGDEKIGLPESRNRAREFNQLFFRRASSRPMVPTTDRPSCLAALRPSMSSISTPAALARNASCSASISPGCKP